jgi:iron complex transport system substrate-binding protein
MPDLRIVSLLPSATEIVYLLGLGDKLVGRSHDSNHPAEALSVPVISEGKIDQKMSSREIDTAVKESVHRGTSLFHIDQKKLARLKPTLILTQELCRVCAPNFDQVEQAAKILKGEYDLISLEPRTLKDLFENIQLVAKYTDSLDAAKSADIRMKFRLDNIKAKIRNLAKPTVAVIEWLDPIMLAGHWVPDMIEAAGGRMVLSKSGEKSRYVDWYEIVNADPDILVLAPCGFEIPRARKEIFLFKHRLGWDKLRAVKNGRVYYMNGDAFLTRSGPRLVDGIEIFSKIIHPRSFGSPLPGEAEQVI